MPRDLSAFFNNKNNAFIKAYVVACDDIVSLVHPSELKQNSAIEYFTDSASEYYRRLAQNNPNDVIVQGPILSVKNHDSLIFNRQAVFIDDKYWGYVGIVVDFSKFLECVKLNVEDNLFVYAIRSSVNKGSSDFIWCDNSLFKYRDKNTKLTLNLKAKILVVLALQPRYKECSLPLLHDGVYQDLHLDGELKSKNHDHFQ